jgi:NADPH:quinone reductase-like Zn-dependent oxidoreductase
MKNKDVKSNIYKKFKLEEAEEAHETIQSRESSGSIILEP